MQRINLINMGLFQLGWFAAVAKGNTWGLPLAALCLVLQLWNGKQLRLDLAMVAACMLIGVIIDGFWLHIGLLAVPQQSGLIPAWLLLVWGLFATTLNHSLAWLQQRHLLSVIAGAVAAPLSYLAGARIGAMQVSDPSQTALAIGVAWALLFPALLQLAGWLQRRLATKPGS